MAIILFWAIGLFSCNLKAQDYQVCFEKNYQPKSEATIASMTPRQLIDELIEFHPSAFHTYEEGANYEDSIRKLVRQAGVEALPILTEYFNKSYQKQSAFGCDNFRVATVTEIAWDIDRFEFRLRGTDKGKQTIDAFERAIKRVEKPGFTEKDVSYYRKSLNDLKGINHFDANIQDTFWVRYQIEMPDKELLEFSNFLIDLDPTYPSWSDTDFIKDYSRINEAGNPAQVYVLKKPERYYDAYLEFQKTKN